MFLLGKLVPRPYTTDVVLKQRIKVLRQLVPKVYRFSWGILFKIIKLFSMINICSCFLISKYERQPSIPQKSWKNRQMKVWTISSLLVYKIKKYHIDNIFDTRLNSRQVDYWILDFDFATKTADYHGIIHDHISNQKNFRLLNESSNL